MSEAVNLSNAGNILSNIGNILISNQNLLCCLYYNIPTALSATDLTIQQIINLCGEGEDLKIYQRIYKSPFNRKIIEEPRSELRFYLKDIKVDNIYLSKIYIAFEIIVHESLWNLSDNKIRPLVIINEILTELNGQDVGGIGSLYLNKEPIRIANFNDEYSGYYFVLETRTT